MKKHSLLFKTFTIFLTLIIAITGFGTSVSAATVSQTCQYLLCSNKLNATSPLKAGSSLPSGVPVYGGQKLTAVDSTFNNKNSHYIFLYCSDYGTGTLAKRHTFSVAYGPHKYNIETSDCIPVHEGDYIVNKGLSNGRPASLYSYNPETGKSDILIEYIEKGNEFYWHYRKYLCGGTNSLTSVVNVSSGNAVSSDDAKSAISGLGGCSDGFYAIDTHDRKEVYVGHGNPSGGFLLFTDENGDSRIVYYNDIKYDSKTGTYKIPGSTCYINSSDWVTDDPTMFEMKFVKIQGVKSNYSGTFYTKGATCGTKFYCDECGWNQTNYAVGYIVFSLKSKNSTTHTFKLACKACGYQYSLITENHEFVYSNYQPLKNTDGTSTKHSVDRKCKTTKGGLTDSSKTPCGYTDTVNENHSWKYSNYSKKDNNTHTYTRTCSGCEYSETITGNHSLKRTPETGYEMYNSDLHMFTESCTLCNHTATKYNPHTFITTYSAKSEKQHSIHSKCECGYALDVSYGNHHDDDGDCYCDDCGYLMTVFSVTVPSALSLVMDKNGNVYSATNAAITNNSSGRVKVSSVKVSGQNGWNIVDYKTNMAKEKVDSKKIGLMMKDSSTNDDGYFTLNSDWTINKNDSLALPYSASVSATSTPIENQEVLKVVFVIDWSGN